ncbi:viral IAP-associated factor [Thecamonas trahens ATCC 50062]|uniref:Viral IAP-associated factor n=1 Tax=Thecamonas trahens ATCC 50062 TaxID=461836 RepID=A0A0L0DNR3_THETB|nr:viral IAP-associated factor [Thecamonas trahens ATCC 50062]KNC53058.1 viral IAP-associated factor [Thecamonas trahens ATCC 50062]|eukprot:XP_013754734.1 viral IAP-associated factor [Thecamonas trahens ATCC 50062]
MAAGLTDWDEAQIRIGNMKAPEPTEPYYPEVTYDVGNGKRLTEEKAEGMGSDDLDEWDDDDDDDLAVLQMIKAKRLAALRAQMASASRGVTEISQSEYIKEVSECSDWIVLHLYQDDNPACRVVHAAMERLAASRPVPVKLLRIVSTAAIPNYPNDLVPSIFFYHEKNLVSKLVSIKQLPGGLGFNADDLEWMLASLGAMDTDMEENPRADEEEFDRRRLVKSSYIGMATSLDDLEAM